MKHKLIPMLISLTFNTKCSNCTTKLLIFPIHVAQLTTYVNILDCVFTLELYVIYLRLWMILIPSDKISVEDFWRMVDAWLRLMSAQNKKYWEEKTFFWCVKWWSQNINQTILFILNYVLCFVRLKHRAEQNA